MATPSSKIPEMLRRFSINNPALIEILFISAYAIEQLSLVVLTYLFEEQAKLIISLFVVIALSTFAIQKTLMQLRINYLEQQVRSLVSYRKEVDFKMAMLSRLDEGLIETVSQESLNKCATYQGTGQKQGEQK